VYGAVVLNRTGGVEVWVKVWPLAIADAVAGADGVALVGVAGVRVQGRP
jgi:hypothetical protein